MQLEKKYQKMTKNPTKKLRNVILIAQLVTNLFSTLFALLPIPGKAQAKAMPGWLYIHTKEKRKRRRKKKKKPLLCPI